MKIAFVSTDSREHNRDYQNQTPAFGTAPTALLQGLSHMSDAEVHVISCTRKPMRSPAKLAQNIWFHSLHVPKWGWMRTGYQGCIRAVRQEVNQLQPDLVHGQGTELDCSLDAVFSGFPNVITIHGNMRQIARFRKARPFSFHWLAARLEALALPRANGVVCITHYAQQAVGQLAKATWVVPNAVDASFFAVDAKPPPGLLPQVLYVAVICALKNQNAFVLALDKLAARQQFQLVFVGEGSPKDPYYAQFKQLIAARPWCIHAGFATREQLKKQLGQASLLVLASREENCPMSVLEAMAAGVPVVASKLGGVPDLLEEGATGFFCDPLEAGSMSAATEKVLANRDHSREMGQRAKTRALKRFHPDVIAQRTLDVYREVLAGPGKPVSGAGQLPSRIRV